MSQAAAIIAAILLIFNATLETGIASQYSPGIMRHVVANRQGWGQLPASLPAVDGYIAVED